MEQKVSIVVPVYNVEKYLKRCVDSLIGQSYPNLEILLVDDGSKDSSLSICKEYELKDSRIRALHKENEGLGLTRNYGIERATGKYITFVDSDDYLTSDAVEAMLGKAEATDADVVIANMFYKDEEMIVYCNFSNQEVGYDTSILNDEKILIKNYEKHQKGTLKPYESIVFYQKSRA